MANFQGIGGSPSGRAPQSTLVQGLDGNFYGTTFAGGGAGFCEVGCGTIFKITPGGTLTTLYQFGPSQGYSPIAALVQGTDGNFYGTTSGGLAYIEDFGGTVFKITPGGTLTTLYHFCTQANCSQGNSPIGALLQGTDGNVYGTTSWDGAHGDGTVFKITAGGHANDPVQLQRF